MSGTKRKSLSPVDEGDEGRLAAKRPRVESVALGQDAVAGRLGGPVASKGVARQNILLLLKDIPAGSTDDPKNPPFSAMVDTAVAGALNPDGMISLSDRTFELAPLGGNGVKRVFVNKDAGDFVKPIFEALRSLRKAHKQGKIDAAKLAEAEKELESTKLRLTELLDADQSHKELAKSVMDRVMASPTPPPQVTNQNTLARFLWDMAMSWMDVRFRALDMYQRHHTDLTPARTYTEQTPWTGIGPPTLENQTRLINARIHGGNLRHDAMLIHLKYGSARHGTPGRTNDNGPAFDTWVAAAFLKVYGLSPEDALWMSQQRNTAQLNWDGIIDNIDRYITYRDMEVQRLADANPRSGGFPALNADVFTAAPAAFAAYAARVKALVDLARAGRTPTAPQHQALVAAANNLDAAVSGWAGARRTESPNLTTRWAATNHLTPRVRGPRANVTLRQF